MTLGTRDAILISAPYIPVALHVPGSSLIEAQGQDRPGVRTRRSWCTRSLAEGQCSPAAP